MLRRHRSDEMKAIRIGNSFFLLMLFVVALLTSSAYARGWLYQNPYPTSYTLTDVKFVSPDKGWLVGQVGTILYTEDGGNTWGLQESSTNLGLTNLFFINDKIGWIVGAGGTILYTADGCKKWVSQNSGFNNYELYKVFFVDPKRRLDYWMRYR